MSIFQHAKLKTQMENGLYVTHHKVHHLQYKQLLETCMKKIRNLRKYEQSVYEMDISQ